MYPWANHLTISLLVAEDERRRRREPAAEEGVRPAAHLPSGIRQVVMQLLRARAVAPAASVGAQDELQDCGLQWHVPPER
jgi:hypothetical protein